MFEDLHGLVASLLPLHNPAVSPEHLKIADEMHALAANGFGLLKRRERLIHFRSAGSQKQREFALRHFKWKSALPCF